METSSASAMRIRYVNTRWDLIVANVHMLVRNRMLQALGLLFSAVIGYSNFTADFEEGVSTLSKVLGSILVVVLGNLLLFLLVLVYLAVTYGLRKNRGLVGEHRLALTEEGIEESTTYNISLNRWKAYYKTTKTKNYLLLYVTEQQAHIIPRKRPLLEGDLEVFEAVLKEKTGKSF